MFSRQFSNISFKGYTTVTYEANKANPSGAAIYSGKKCNILFGQSSALTFMDNRAEYGGAVFSVSYSQISFDGNTTVT